MTALIGGTESCALAQPVAGWIPARTSKQTSSLETLNNSHLLNIFLKILRDTVEKMVYLQC